MIWTVFGVVYFLSGTGVMLALDDNIGSRNKLSTLLTAFALVVFWPMFFMFAVVAALRSLADGKIRKVSV